MQGYINHITKTKFLPCFKAAFNISITKSSILESFRGADLDLLDLEAMVLKLQVWLHMPTSLTIDNGL